jgi:hypothetical protein
MKLDGRYATIFCRPDVRRTKVPGIPASNKKACEALEKHIHGILGDKFGRKTGQSFKFEGFNFFNKEGVKNPIYKTMVMYYFVL